MNYEEGSVMTVWNVITEYIHNDEVLYLKEVPDILECNYILTNHYEISSLVDSLYAEYLTKCHIRKLDPEILALVIKV